MARDALTLPPRVAPCPQCQQPAQLAPEYKPWPAFVWTDGWIERRDGTQVPPGWVQCPHCQAIDTHGAWERRSHIGTWENRAPPAREPPADALRRHLSKLLEGRVELQHAHQLRLQLWWLANARRRGADVPPPLEEADSRELFRLLRPPDAPGFEGGIRRIEAFRELGLFDQARQLIRDTRAQLDRLETLVEQGDVFPRLWHPEKPIVWPEPESMRGNADTL